MKILLWKIGALGDVIMTTPLIRALRKAYPKAQIDYLIGASCKIAIEHNPHLTSIKTFDGNILYKKQFWKIPSLICQMRGYDMIFVLDKHWTFNRIAQLSGIPQRVGFDRNGEGKGLTHTVPFDGSLHEIDAYLALAKAISVKPTGKETELTIRKEDEATAVKLLHGIKNFVCLCPGGGRNQGRTSPEKLWPIEKYYALAKQLPQVVVLTIPSEESSVSLLKETGARIISTTSIGTTAAIMKKARCVVCNDSGPLHIASTATKKIVALFGPTDPKRFAPYSATVICKADHALNQLDGTFAPGSEKLMEKITVTEVLDAINKHRDEE
jgi:lipopolysaccharide heptosyltransferase II